MKITCTDQLDFIAHLNSARVIGNRIYVNIHRQHEDHISLITYHASAVIVYEDTSSTEKLDEQMQYFLEFNLDCGHDLLTADGHHDASDLSRQLHEGLENFCDESPIEFKLLPGILETS